MICFLAMLVFGVLGIFSASYRHIAAEAFNCVFKKLTLRKCDTGLDTRLKSQITGKLLKRAPKVGKFVFKNFETISTVFTLLFLLSIIGVGYSGYNYYLYGNCNGPQSDGFCIFDPTGENSMVSEVEQNTCSVEPVGPAVLTAEGFPIELFPIYNEGAENTVIFIGCYGCEYTHRAYSEIRKLIERADVTAVIAHFPTKESFCHAHDVTNCIYEQDPDKLMEYNDLMYSETPDHCTDEVIVQNVIESLGIDLDQFNSCVASEENLQLREKQLEALKKTNIYGTPLVFVNGEPVVGPKPYRVYKRLLK